MEQLNEISKPKSYIGRKVPLLKNQPEVPSTSKIQQAVMKTEKGYKCFRCGNEDQRYFYSHPCAWCHSECTYCRKCINMGKMTTCTKLVVNEEDVILKEPISALAWSGELSPQQKEASNQVVSAIKNETNLLLWAVCGAGKTEMLFQGIETALQQGKNVCIATPRVDVVIELVHRFRQAFPTISIVALYGGSEEKWDGHRIVITTVHQLMSFRRAFHLLVIDEVDAFPYNIEKHLHWVANEARTVKGSTIQLTATPSVKQQQLALKGKIPNAMVPARFHRQPLPVPRFQWIGNWRNYMKKHEALPPALTNWITSHLPSKCPIFLFVPTIKESSLIEEYVRKLTPLTASVHSEDPERHEKVASFRKGEILVLVTTTILERGVTIVNSQIAVLGADEEIFTESALVQIAGRAGRHPQFAKGDVIYFHHGKSEEMVKARNQILLMNKLGFEKGWLDSK
ncbi:DEAD/DEAH box helicase [Bacillus sp. RG28]|uniref:DEAD/DEAH box helicase n=1 Tax=Gottfriedia endophytica TaxID=2820819 RepID=A0A940NR49_9BACI|nr:DEAD/DEAH box helicase [Gottfriedia endophytica]MBP0726749.1 DEAD/DEAH box helicase [Gottfriedia endophytica]